MDVLTPLIWVAFYALFAVSIQRYRRYRTPLDRGVMLVFGSTAALFAVSVINAIQPAFASWFGPIAVTLLVAQPVLMVHLVGLFVPLPRLVVPLVTSAFVVSVAAFYLSNRSIPATVLLLAYFGITEALAAITLLRESLRRHGFPRIRLALAGTASLLFGLAIVVVGAAATARGSGTDPAVQLVGRLLALLAGLGYLAAFAPPRWLVQIAHRALAFDLVRSIVSAPTGTEPGVHWHALALATSRILGTDRIRISRDEEVLADAGSAAALVPMAGSASAIAATGAGSSREMLTIPLVSEGREIAMLTAGLDGRDLFLEDDVALIGLLGSLTARAVEREQAVTALVEARRAVAEAAATRASETRFRAFLDAGPNAMLAVDSGGRIRWSTRSAAEMFGIPEPVLAGRLLEDLVSRRTIAPRIEPRSAAVRYETTARRPDGSTFPVELALTTFAFEGEPYELVVVSDVTWRHEADAIRERFIGVLSHELRTPITAIFGGTQLLLRRNGQLDPATRTELLVDIAGESERLQRMIENLLILARVEGGTGVAETGPVLLQRVLPPVIEREQAMWPGLTISADVAVALPPVSGDEASLALVLGNLISNAGKYAGSDACVTIRVDRQSDGEVAVRVLDDGPGFDDADAGRLFDLYFRSKESHAVPGSGIGLFVCQHLVGAMGGRTWARARPEGGAEFGFTLPVYEDQDQPIAVVSRPAMVAGGRPAAAIAPIRSFPL